MIYRINQFINGVIHIPINIFNQEVNLRAARSIIAVSKLSYPATPSTFAAQPARVSHLDGRSQKLPKQPVYLLRRILLRPMRDAGQPFDA